MYILIAIYTGYSGSFTLWTVVPLVNLKAKINQSFLHQMGLGAFHAGVEASHFWYSWYQVPWYPMIKSHSNPLSSIQTMKMFFHQP